MLDSSWLHLAADQGYLFVGGAGRGHGNQGGQQATPLS